MSRVSPVGTSVFGAIRSGRWPALVSSAAASARKSSLVDWIESSPPDGTDIGAVMHPDCTSFSNWPLPAGAPGHKIVETEMAKLMPAVGGEHHIAARRSGDQGAQRFEPADEPAASLRGRLPPRAARRHDDDRWPGAILPGNLDHDVARIAGVQRLAAPFPAGRRRREPCRA